MAVSFFLVRFTKAPMYSELWVLSISRAGKYEHATPLFVEIALLSIEKGDGD